MQNLSPPKSTTFLDMDYFLNTLSTIKLNNVSPRSLASIIAHYAPQDSPEDATSSWMKKRLFIETLMTILPPGKDSIPCNSLLRLLRVAKSVTMDATYCDELETRVSWLLDEATLEELMIPAFSHTCGTLLDVDLVFRIVRKCVDLEEVGKISGGKLAKVAKLVDCYLAEAAVDSLFALDGFVALASAVPRRSRTVDDGLYRAVDIYLKAHPGLSKQERKTLWNLIDTRKLSLGASQHASQNERLPVRAVIQVLLSEQSKLNKHIVEWSGSLSATRSPGCPARSQSKREMNIQHMEIKRLKEDVLRLQSQCMYMEKHVEKLLEKKNKLLGYSFSWKKLGILGFNKAGKIGEIEGGNEAAGFGVKTPVEMKTRLVRGKPRCREE